MKTNGAIDGDDFFDFRGRALLLASPVPEVVSRVAGEKPGDDRADPAATGSDHGHWMKRHRHLDPVRAVHGSDSDHHPGRGVDAEPGAEPAPPLADAVGGLPAHHADHDTMVRTKAPVTSGGPQTNAFHTLVTSHSWNNSMTAQRQGMQYQHTQPPAHPWPSGGTSSPAS